MISRRTSNPWKAIFPILLTMVALSQSARASDDKGSIKAFIDSIAEVTYAAAWPSATYKSVSIKDTTAVSGGYDVAVRLAGESTFGGSLWLDLVFEIRNGGLHDIRVRNHNAILVPPFETTKALGAFVEEMIDDYNSSRTPPTTSGRPPTTAGKVGAVCIMNPTEHTLNFSYRWGEDGEWTSQTVNANYNSWYWWPYSGSREVSPKFYIRFDDSFASGYTEKGYWLKRYSTTLPVTCEKANRYRFTTNGRSVDIEPSS